MGSACARVGRREHRHGKQRSPSTRPLARRLRGPCASSRPGGRARAFGRTRPRRTLSFNRSGTLDGVNARCATDPCDEAHPGDGMGSLSQGAAAIRCRSGAASGRSDPAASGMGSLDRSHPAAWQRCDLPATRAAGGVEPGPRSDGCSAGSDRRGRCRTMGSPDRRTLDGRGGPRDRRRRHVR
jgi:hypothetical protein